MAVMLVNSGLDFKVKCIRLSYGGGQSQIAYTFLSQLHIVTEMVSSSFSNAVLLVTIIFKVTVSLTLV